MTSQTNQELARKVAQLESINDQLNAEVAYINELLISVGFSNGLTSVKKVAEEILKESR